MPDSRPRIGVLTFPGSNDDTDARLALDRVGAEAISVWHQEEALPELAGVLVPGGFSYGDYLRCGAIARVAPVMEAVTRFAESGGLVLGICNGFQILCESGLLPGALRRNDSLRFVCRDATIVVAASSSPFLSRCAPGDPLTIPIKHGEGAYFAPPELVDELERHDQIALRYAAGANPNGSIGDIAGVSNRAGNVMGLMPHPEHAVNPLIGSDDGALILGSFVDAARSSTLLTAPV